MSARPVQSKAARSAPVAATPSAPPAGTLSPRLAYGTRRQGPLEKTLEALPRWRSFALAAMSLAAAIVYLFVTAPPPLAAVQPSAAIPIGDVLAVLQAENQVVRALWTEEMVKSGKQVGLKFDEAWRDKTVEAGPLPALFLRETARNLERYPGGLSLFLGSEFPVAVANRFSGVQSEAFRRIRDTRQPQFFFESETRRYTAMFADVAAVDTCVTCHNEHPNSPKRDWKLHDVMGATTWMYPDERVTIERALVLVSNLRAGVRATYASYLDKVATFGNRPGVGAKWPRDGFYLPSVDVFMEEVARRASPATLGALSTLGARGAPRESSPPGTVGPLGGQPTSSPSR